MPRFVIGLLLATACGSTPGSGRAASPTVTATTWTESPMRGEAPTFDDVRAAAESLRLMAYAAPPDMSGTWFHESSDPQGTTSEQCEWVGQADAYTVTCSSKGTQTLGNLATEIETVTRVVLRGNAKCNGAVSVRYRAEGEIPREDHEFYLHNDRVWCTPHMIVPGVAMADGTPEDFGLLYSRSETGGQRSDFAARASVANTPLPDGLAWQQPLPDGVVPSGDQHTWPEHSVTVGDVELKTLTLRTGDSGGLSSIIAPVPAYARVVEQFTRAFGPPHASISEPSTMWFDRGMLLMVTPEDDGSGQVALIVP